MNLRQAKKFKASMAKVFKKAVEILKHDPKTLDKREAKSLKRNQKSIKKYMPLIKKASNIKELQNYFTTRAMEEKEKRRAASRNRTEAVVVCRPFSSGGAARAADGVMRNFSDEGFYIESSRNFKLGTILHLRIVHYPAVSLSPVADTQLRSICLAEVKWRQEMVGENTTQYGFGLRYLD